MSKKTAPNVVVAVPRVNLMPRVEVERRQQAAQLRRWGWGVVAALIIVALVGAGCFTLKWVADGALVAQQQKSVTLLTQLASMTKVSRTLATERQLGTFSTNVRAEDIGWAQTLTALESALPKGVVLTGFDLVPGAQPVPGAGPHAAAGLSGQLTMTSNTALDITPVIRSTRQLGGVLSADGKELTSAAPGAGQSTTYTYQLTIVFDQSIYTNTNGAK